MSKKKKVAIIGGGPAGMICAIAASKNADVTVFEKNEPLKTLLYTGGGRCNLSNAIFDFKELASYYPRGEKFLYSVFSKFGVGETLDFFNNIGVQTYIQDDNRIFPISDSAEVMREAILMHARKQGVKFFLNAKLNKIDKSGEKFSIKGEKFDVVVVSTGGNTNNPDKSGYAIATNFGHKIMSLRPALCALVVKEKWTSELSGVALRDSTVYTKYSEIKGDLLFTHNGISGPAVFKTSSLCAYANYSKEKPLEIVVNLVNKDYERFDVELIKNLNENPKKSIGTIVCHYAPRSFVSKVLEVNNINWDTQACQISKATRQTIVRLLTGFELNAISPAYGGEIVTAGGVCLDEINPKTMESKLKDGLYFCGELLDIDGFTGGFNLQACWSTGYIAGMAIAEEDY